MADTTKQEPVAWLHDDGYWTPAKTESGRQLSERLMFAGAPKIAAYAAPVDAKVILEMRDKAFQSYVDQVKADRELSVLQARLEALEEAAKVCEGFSNTIHDQRMIAAIDCAAAIRSLCQKTDKGG